MEAVILIGSFLVWKPKQIPNIVQIVEVLKQLEINERSL